MTSARSTRSVVALSVVLLHSFALVHADIKKPETDFKVDFSGSLKEEMFYGKSITLLNNDNALDKAWYMRHTFDAGFDVNYGQKTYGRDVAQLKVQGRNKGAWGNLQSTISTFDGTFKISQSVTGSHKHFIPRHLFWIRQAWMKFDLAPALDWNLINEHTFTIGAFPFKLGRGIALGGAYSVAPGLLGFYTKENIDQYPFALKVSNEFFKDKLTHDLYLSILRNKSTSFSETAEKIRGQEYGHLSCPERGFGRVNVLAAGRWLWTLFKHNGTATLEPYWMFNHDPEQKVEFLGDASSRLGTLGMAGEYKNNRFECGFDTAVNLGSQTIKGWDRNVVKLANRNGTLVECNSHVTDAAGGGTKIPYTSSGSAAQTIANEATRDQNLNGMQIGTVATDVGYLTGPVDLFNASNRFRDGYKNTYKGMMFVGDLAYWVHNREVRLALEAGITTGDDNPNEETIDGDFSGFVGLQEVYAGKRVRSVFTLGGAGKLRRPLSSPTSSTTSSRFSKVVSGFTNLMYVGGGVLWQPKHRSKKFKVNPNIISYWQHSSIKKFDCVTKMDLKEDASKHLGIEGNMFFEYDMLKDLTLFFVGSVFVPGRHYTHIKGKPLDAAQQKVLDQTDVTGFAGDPVPNISDNIAFTVNTGLTFKF